MREAEAPQGLGSLESAGSQSLKILRSGRRRVRGSQDPGTRSVGLWRQKLYGAGEEVREPQGSRALNVRLNRRAQKLCGEVEKREQGSADLGAFDSGGGEASKLRGAA